MKVGTAGRLDHLDGLRAIAVLGVLMFHFEVPNFGGGYAGVDIFLSISGFLITRNIVHSISTDKFTLREFYVRRLFRLLPSSTVAIIATCLASVCIMSTTLTQAVFDSARAALLFHANIFFHLKSGYFDDGPELKPLLHMWSLSLEEQFYFLWAPLLVVIACLPNRERTMPAAALVLGAVSFITAVLINTQTPSFVFFELPPRIFQFAAGAFLSFMPALSRSADNDSNLLLSESEPAADPNEGRPSGALSNILSLLALCAIFITYKQLPRAAPALLMLPTTIATCVLIATPSSWVSRHVLTMRVPKHIGHLSYTMYLVHWPLYVFSKYLLLGLNKPEPHALVLLLGTYAMAVVLHHVVENPLRDPRNTRRRTAFLVVSVATVAAVCGAGELLRGGHVADEMGREADGGMESRDGVAPECLANFSAAIGVIGEKVKYGMLSEYEIGDADAKHSGLVLIGNSYAGHLGLGLAEVMRARGMRMTTYMRGGCQFVGRGAPVHNAPKCGSTPEKIWALLDGRNETGLRVMVALNWRDDDEKLKLDEQVLGLYEDMRAAGHQLLIIGRPPMQSGELRGFFPCVDVHHRKLLPGLKNECVDIRSGFCPNAKSKTDDNFRRLVESGRLPVPVLDWKKYMCYQDAGVKCPIKMRCGFPVYNDTAVGEIGFARNLNHLSAVGSFNLAYVLDDFLFSKAANTTVV